MYMYICLETNYQLLFIASQQTPIYIFSHNPTIKIHQLIQVSVVRRLHRICSSDTDYTAKSKEYTKYFANRRHDLKSLQQCLNMLVKYCDRKHEKR